MAERSTSAETGPIPSALVATVKRSAPILPVRDLGIARAFYDRLGFATHEYEGGGYGFAKRDRVEIHLGVVPGHQASAANHSAYLWVDDADALAREWHAAGVHVHMPEDTEWGQHEGAVVDPDGNVLRFGSRLRRPATEEP
jgi:catechol 2,3-dioxygenase-like lactoylglutathione lyase family enzyme